jgi:hypothetical protein
MAALLRNQPPFSRIQLISFSFLIFSFRQYPSLHDIALPSLILGAEWFTFLTVTMFGLDRHVESLAAAVSPYYTPE